MPLRDKRGYLWDMQQAALNIQRFTEGESVETYQENVLLRSAVERQFEIIGEALRQALQHFPELDGNISASRQIIAFRNRLIHAYAAIDDEVVWGIIEDDLPTLLQDVERLLVEED